MQASLFKLIKIFPLPAYVTKLRLAQNNSVTTRDKKNQNSTLLSHVPTYHPNVFILTYFFTRTNGHCLGICNTVILVLPAEMFFPFLSHNILSTLRTHILVSPSRVSKDLAYLIIYSLILQSIKLYGGKVYHTAKHAERTRIYFRLPVIMWNRNIKSVADQILTQSVKYR